MEVDYYGSHFWSPSVGDMGMVVPSVCPLLRALVGQVGVQCTLGVGRGAQ